MVSQTNALNEAVNGMNNNKFRPLDAYLFNVLCDKMGGTEALPLPIETLFKKRLKEKHLGNCLRCEVNQQSFPQTLIFT